MGIRDKMYQEELRKERANRLNAAMASGDDAAINRALNDVGRGGNETAPKSGAGSIIGGGVIGAIVAGPAGAVVGALAGKAKYDAKNK